jgi:cyclic pyranopterin phosphate synthase
MNMHSHTGGQASLVDAYGRRIDYVRIAVTEACNLRCTYCLRDDSCTAPAMKDALDTAQMTRLIGMFGQTGFRKVRFTGGEPLLRKDLVRLVSAARETGLIRNIRVTTNGLLLADRLKELVEAGVDGFNISLDTLDAERFRTITRRDEFGKVRRSLDLLLERPDMALKINMLLLRGINQDEIPAFVELTRTRPVTVRFMELQPFDDHQIWRTGRFMGAEMIRELLYREFPQLEQMTGGGTEHYSFRIPGHLGSIAIIPAYSRNFCSRCSRLRVTADGHLVSCLYRDESVDLKPFLREGGSPELLRARIEEAVRNKPKDGIKSGRGNAVSSMSRIGG